METITSVVTAVKDKGDKYGIACGFNNWYNGFGKLPCKKGDKVQFTFEVNDKGFKNIGSLTVLGSNTLRFENEGNDKIQAMSKLKNQTNARVAALTNATNLCIARGEITLEHVIEEAHKMLEFLENDKVF